MIAAALLEQARALHDSHKDGRISAQLIEAIVGNLETLAIMVEETRVALPEPDRPLSDDLCWVALAFKEQGQTGRGDVYFDRDETAGLAEFFDVLSARARWLELRPGSSESRRQPFEEVIHALNRRLHVVVCPGELAAVNDFTSEPGA